MVEALAYSAGDPGLISGSGRSPGEGNGNPLQYCRLENSMDGGAWWARYATVHGSWGGKELDTTERLHFHFSFKDYFLMKEQWNIFSHKLNTAGLLAFSLSFPHQSYSHSHFLFTFLLCLISLLLMLHFPFLVFQ